MKDTLRYGILYGLRGGQFVTHDRKLAHYVKRELRKYQAVLAEVKHKTDTAYSVSTQLTGIGSVGTDSSLTDGSDEQTGTFLRGMFIACGNVYIQKAGYHLEIMPDSEEKCAVLHRLITEHGMTINISRRGRTAFLYSKNSENISDILTYMGAMRCAMEIMNIKIIKEVRSNINRSVNCETANIDRTARASAKQLDDIAFIFEKLGRDKLPEELCEIAELRLANPDMSLRDLGKLVQPEISRSGVNHRFERLTKLAAELREKQ
jgi:DNA-binding protein WhiA